MSVRIGNVEVSEGPFTCERCGVESEVMEVCEDLGNRQLCGWCSTAERERA